MLKTIVVLPDGTELSSGVGTRNAIKSITLTECVNDSQELTLGSTCSNMIDITAITPNGGFSISKGDEFTVYREDINGIRYKVGMFTSEKPARSSAHSLKITAYDRVSWLDRDLTTWIAGLTAWPYTLYDFAKMTCEQCGLNLKNHDIPNGSHLIQHFSANGITGRKIMKWIGEIAGRFCRATSDGLIEFAWYQSSSVLISAKDSSVLNDYSNGITVFSPGVMIESDNADNVSISGENIGIFNDGEGNIEVTFANNENAIKYYQGGLSFSDYRVEPIQKVQIKCSEDDIGTVYPNDLLEAVNTYVISGNYLLTATDADDLKPIAQTLFEQLQDVSYTPCTVKIPANFLIHAGDIVKITDVNGITISAYIMTKKQTGQRDSLECTGSARRDSSSAVNEQSYAVLNGKVLNLQMNVEGLRLENKDTAGKLASMSMDLNSIAAEVQNQSESIDGITQEITLIQQKSESIKLSVQSIQDDGVSKVKTETGFSFDQEGLHISKSNSDMENTLDETGMCVRRNSEVILQANDDGVLAVDVTVRNYLIIGNHARFEDYSSDADSNRTACFWL